MFYGCLVTPLSACSSSTQIAATILGHPDRANWKNCLLSDDEESRIVDQLKDSFQRYDFTAAEEEGAVQE